MATKTPVTVLQELTVKFSKVPHYEFLEPDIMGVFECKASAMGVFVTGKGRCKKDAKQDAARLVIEKLVKAGKYMPQTCDNLSPPKHLVSAPAAEIVTNNVGVLKDLCVEFRMPVPEYIVLDETGLSHSKQFTVQCKISSLERTATSNTKKQAKQMAAGLLVKYFNEHMASRIAEFAERPESQSLSKLNDSAKEKYFDQAEVWRPNLGQIISNYYIEADKITEAVAFLESTDSSDDNVDRIEKLLKLLGMEFQWENLDSDDNTKNIVLLKIPHANPAAFFAAPASNEFQAKNLAAVQALEYFSLMLTM